MLEYIILCNDVYFVKEVHNSIKQWAINNGHEQYRETACQINDCEWGLKSYKWDLFCQHYCIKVSLKMQSAQQNIYEWFEK